MFSSNATPAEEFKYASDIGAIINLDDITHIEYLERITALPKTLCCRYNPGGLFQMSNGIMDNPGDAKYGMTTEQIFEAFRTLKDKGVENFGSMHFLASNTCNLTNTTLCSPKCSLTCRSAKGTDGCQTSPSSICPAASEYPTHLIRSQITLPLSVKRSEKSMKRSSFPQAWIILHSIQSSDVI